MLGFRRIAGLSLPVILIGLSCVSSMAKADSPAPKPRPGAEKMARSGNKMRVAYQDCLAKLNLSTDKKDKLEAINKKFAAKRMAIAKSNATPDEKKAKIQALAKERQAEVAKVLTTAQQEQLKRCLKEHRPKFDKSDRKGRDKSKTNRPGDAPG